MELQAPLSIPYGRGREIVGTIEAVVDDKYGLELIQAIVKAGGVKKITINFELQEAHLAT